MASLLRQANHPPRGSFKAPQGARLTSVPKPELLGEVQIREHLPVLGLEDVAVRQSPLGDAYGGNAPQIRLARTLEVHLVIERFDGFLRRVTALEGQFADTGFDGAVGRQFLRESREAQRSCECERDCICSYQHPFLSLWIHFTISISLSCHVFAKNGSRAWSKVTVSRTALDVAPVGKPSLNSRGPTRVSTRSGADRDCTTASGTCATADAQATSIDASTVKMEGIVFISSFVWFGSFHFRNRLMIRLVFIGFRQGTERQAGGEILFGSFHFDKVSGFAVSVEECTHTLVVMLNYPADRIQDQFS